MFIGHYRVSLALVLMLGVGGCRATSPAAPAATVATAPPEPAPPPAGCEAPPLAFRPRTGVTYRARVEEKRSVYRSSLTYAPDGAGGWIATERAFSLQRPGGGDSRWDGISKGELRWKLDARGVPVAEPERTGYQGPCCLEAFSYYTFAPVGFTASSTCPGTAWEGRWTAAERERSFRFRIERAGRPGGSATVRVDGLIKTSVNAWKIDGTFEVSLEDGLTGGGEVHVGGPGAPTVNDLSRKIQIAPNGD